MNYEKAYKEDLGRARKCLDEKRDTCFVRPDVIFPELAESEDERIRKALLEYFGEECDTATINGIYCYKIYNWLEKQGKKPQVDGFDAELNALLKKYEHLSKKELQESLEFYLGVVRDDPDVVREEKMPTWTEEDEKCIDNCCLLIGAADDCYEKPFKDDCIHYLQSLKERIEWKPKWTDEDEKRLQSCISALQGKGLMGGVDTINTKWLKSLKQRIIIKIKTWGFSDNDEVPENLIPELKESEDEKIRKELINRINGLWENDAVMWPSTLEEKNKYITWLEKQGNQESFIDDLEMTLSVSDDTYLRGNIEGLIKEFKQQ